MLVVFHVSNIFPWILKVGFVDKTVNFSDEISFNITTTLNGVTLGLNGWLRVGLMCDKVVVLR